MDYTPKTRDQHLKDDNLPKRILALDGGGLRGILTLGMLQHIEDILRERHQASDDFRLCHYFDIIAGTSTGSIIAAALALGWTVQEIREHYFELGVNIFKRRFWRRGILWSKYVKNSLATELKSLFGEQTLLGGDELKTGLLIVTKRLDSGSPWPISNNPYGKYYDDRESGSIGNRYYPLWQVVRASTAAPTYFDPEYFTIVDRPGFKPVAGQFVDGGVSPFNNPALQALMYATLDGYRLRWKTGENRLLLVSLGTGMADPTVEEAFTAAGHGINALNALMHDCASLQETLLQWMSASETARHIDSELGSLGNDLIGAESQMTYLRYDVDLSQKGVQALDPALVDLELIHTLKEMDIPANMHTLHRLGTLAAQRDMRPDMFPGVFDIAVAPKKQVLSKYRKKPDQYVTAVQLDLDSNGFEYRKWGSTQQCKAGDWLVSNNGDTYTIDRDTFTRTYRQLEPGKYLKTSPVWAKRTTTEGSVSTNEGESHYRAGDYLVYNNEDGSDAYCVSREKFEAMYEADDSRRET